MNILFLSKDYPPDLVGGVGVYVKEASQALVRMSHNVFVITGTQDREVEYIDQGVRVCRVKTRKLKIFNAFRDILKGFIDRLEYSLAVSRKIKEIVRQYNIDIVESCEARAEGFWYFLFNKKPKLIIKLHTPESIVFKLNHDARSLDYILMEHLEHWWIERADKVIGLTDAITHLTCRYFNIKKNSFPKVANPIDISRFNQEECLGNGQKSVLYVGRLEFRKGVHILIKAMPEVIKKYPKARFIFVGADCGMSHYIVTKARQLKVFNNIDLIGEIERNKVKEYYFSASCCVVPSLWENHPYVCLEAMACGRPVIASKVGGIPEIIRDGTTGLLFNSGSFNALAEVIIRVLGNEELASKLGSNAKEYIKNEYSIDKIIKQTVDIYEKVINDRR